MAIDLTNLRNKVENNGETDQGVLRAADFNNLVSAVIENQDAVINLEKTSVKEIVYNEKSYKADGSGKINITVVESGYFLAFDTFTAPQTYVAKNKPCTLSFTIKHKDINNSTDDNYVCANFAAYAKVFVGKSMEDVKEVTTIYNIYDSNYPEDKLSAFATKTVTVDITKFTTLTTSESGNTVYVELYNGINNPIRSTISTIFVFDMDISLNVGHVENTGTTEPVFTDNDKQVFTLGVNGTNARMNMSISKTNENGEKQFYSIFSGKVFNNGERLTINCADIEDMNEYPALHNVNTHGIHEIKLWGTPLNSNGNVLDESIVVEYPTIRYIYGTNETPLIMSSVDTSVTYQEYNKLPITYIAYYKNMSTDKEISLYISDSEDNIILRATQTIEFKNSAASGTYTFSLTPPVGSHFDGVFNLNILLGEGENICHDISEIRIEKINVNLVSIGGYDVYLNSASRSNDENSDTLRKWITTSSDGKKQFEHVLFDNVIEFNESGSGWNKDDNGNTVMRLRKNRYFDVLYTPFDKNPTGSKEESATGLTISIEFAIRNCLDRNATVIKCIDDDPTGNGNGFRVTGNKVELISENKTLNAEFKENERIKLDIVIEPKPINYKYDTVVGTDGTVYQGNKDEALMIIFIDGVYQRLSLIESGDSFKQINPKNITFGSDKCDLDIYNIRVYRQDLNIDQIVKNYSYDTPDYIDKVNIFKRNNIFVNAVNNTPEIDLGLLQEARPDLPIVFITMAGNAALPKDKSKWLPLSIATYSNPNTPDTNEAGNSSWETVYGVFRNQGTSSMNYPWPWRNWDFKLNKYIEGGKEKKGFFEMPTLGGKQESKWYQYFGMPGGLTKLTWKKDYASSEMCNNAICSEIFTDMALGIANEYPDVLSYTMRPDLDKTKYRLTFKATPCFMFNKIVESEDSTPRYEGMGMMNLIPNKNECDYLGFIYGNEWEDNETDETTGELKVFPRAQSWEIKENHIFWDYELHSYHADNLNPGDIVNGYTVTQEFDENGKSSNYFGKVAEVYEKDEDGNEIPVFVKSEDNSGNVTETTTNEEEALKDEDGKPRPYFAFQNFGNYINGVDGNYEARYPKDSTSGFEDFGYFGDSIKTDKETFDRVYNEHKDILDFHNWLVSCNRGLATGEDLTEEQMNVFWNRTQSTIDKSGKTIFTVMSSVKHTKDTTEYRKDKFTYEAQGYLYNIGSGNNIEVKGRLLVDQWVLYYIWRETFWMFDSGSKNLQVYTMDEFYKDEEVNRVLQWGCMVRDADTALGIDNIGVDKFPAWLEDIDYYVEKDGKITFTYGGAKDCYTAAALANKNSEAAHVLNGQFGSIWLNIRDCFSDRISNIFRQLSTNSSKTNFSFALASKRFNDHQDNWCESLYNFGMRQYFGGTPFSDRITSGNGNKRHQRNAWLEKAFVYRNSKYRNLSDAFNFRAVQYPTKDTRKSTINVKTYIPMYVGTGGTEVDMKACKYLERLINTDAGLDIPVTAEIGFGMPTTGTDKNTYLFGASYITDLGDLARHLDIGDLTIPYMPKLTSLKLGDHTNSYKRNVTTVLEDGTSTTTEELFFNARVKKLDCSQLPSLAYLDVTRFRQLGAGDGSLTIDSCLQLEELYASGTDNISSLIFPETSTLRVAHIGGGIKNLKMSNLTSLEDFRYDGFNNLQTLTIENCSDYISTDISKEIVEKYIENLETTYKNGNINVCTLHGINWVGIDQRLLIRLVNICKPGDIKGVITLSGGLSYQNKTLIMTKFGNIDNPENNLHIKYTPAGLGNITMQSKRYITTTGSYQLYFIPQNAAGNNFDEVVWSIDGSIPDAVDVSLETNGLLTVRRIGTEETKPFIKVTVTIKQNGQVINGGLGTATGEIHLYLNKAKVGDVVYHDGTYTSFADLDTTKTPVGICFYIYGENTDNPRRLMMALRNCPEDAKYVFGPETSYNNGSDPSINSLHTLYLDSNDFASTLEIIDINGTQHERLWTNLYSEASGWIEMANNSLAGSIGLRDITTNDSNDNDSTDFLNSYKPGDKEWYGKYYTAAIIDTRNRIINDQNVYNSSYVIPNDQTVNQATGNKYTELQHLRQLIYTSGIAHQWYYPMVSYCYAYQPVNSDSSLIEGLADKFKPHNWWLPSFGEALRMNFYYAFYVLPVLREKYSEETQTLLNIFEPFYKNDTINLDSFTRNLATSSIPYGTDAAGVHTVSLTSGSVAINYSRYGRLSSPSSITVRPICEF